MVDTIKDFVNRLAYPTFSFPLSLLLLLLALWSKRLWTKTGGLVLLAVGVAFFGVSMLDADFLEIVTKGDNVPIAMMVFLVGFFVWLSMHKAHENDRLAERGEPTFEKTEVEDKVFTWPDLVFSEFICMVVLTVVMVVWSIGIRAPLEEPANLAIAPNPSKAPWYFLGLQEMLVYFDPWMAGVVLPGLIILGLMAIPYIDTSPKGNGYFTFRERKTEIGLFLFGFVVLWCQMIVIGTFLRGPNWNFFGPYEYWDINKVEPLVNVDLSEIFWIKLLKTGLPGHWAIRELPGIVLLAGYFFVLPFALTRSGPFERYAKAGWVGRVLLWLPRTLTRRCRTLFEKMGPTRYGIGITLILVMMLMPIKMFCRWLFNLKYFVHIQEFFFNI